MRDTEEFFNEFLPKKIDSDPNLADETAVFEFNITGAGTWTLDLGGKTVQEGPHAAPNCRVTTDRATWEAILAKPGYATQAFMMGKLKASNVGLATKLQKILG